ncbi:MAG: hypothetical protein K0B84_02340 [Firmicutes bacterium]|nr:hypothetical protein [Bacillota bacterium]
MSKAAFSVRVFSIYAMVLGVLLIVVPNTLLAVFQVPETNEIWIRVAGVLVLIIGYYYFMASGKELLDFFKWSVYGRLSVLVFFLGFVILGLDPATLVLVGAIDALAALWTAICLRKEA